MPELAKELRNVTNQTLATIQPSAIRKFDQEISQIPGIIKLTLGEPDLNTPEHVKQAAIASIAQDDSHYSAPKGKMSLRQAISAYLRRKQNITYDPETEIIVTVGATEALTATIFSLVNPGDEVIIPTPSYALYFPLLKLAGAKLIEIDTSTTQFVLTPETLAQTLVQHPQAKFIILNYPGNPTGQEYSKTLLQQLAAVIRQYPLGVIADEIYSELVYEQPHYSIARILPERTVLVNGLSKSHAMTGYRSGYVVAPGPWIQAIAKMHGFLVTCPPDTAQAAALEALSTGDEDPQAAVTVYQHRRDDLEQALVNLDFQPLHPQGAFYLFAKIPAQYGDDDLTFARQLAQKAKVGCTPGRAFGQGGQGYLRFSYASSDEILQQAVQRITYFLNGGID
ncbi:aminotransferase class I/II-fold pyridoxal phosphate-dependent enzyme [Bombilactobacillus folatiphilus]|uniref:Aminotransferase class I/II-fold pyridoxal phosphate-dependent enzyme n=1 Tax=Bombilactobacillus folatiphilus TaxID=2923362 RepID=A0ABY4PAE2_9LACO|nr:aminotransferase class I/II-fold pyridoxal phosphate-dependent enzyme [Bombilactobacillus folatiphilus]UQS82524.1 aminotransferase class I/II-fold pyridoxal phosphate-dependent enzyme [Bombilactobacillus folatiphilus]